jgi:hypothetical protein
MPLKIKARFEDKNAYGKFNVMHREHFHSGDLFPVFPKFKHLNPNLLLLQTIFLKSNSCATIKILIKQTVIFGIMPIRLIQVIDISHIRW